MALWVVRVGHRRELPCTQFVPPRSRATSQPPPKLGGDTTARQNGARDGELIRSVVSRAAATALAIVAEQEPAGTQ
jgi:hypothetical protein